MKFLQWIWVALHLLMRCKAIYVPDDGDVPKYCTVFGHMMKSGGSTIKWALDTAQSPEERQPGLCVFAVYNRGGCRAVAENSTVVEGYSELVRGPLQDAGRENCEFFTMMRHPVDRLVSQFFYCPTDHDIQHRPLKWCGDYEHEEPLSYRLVEFASKYWGNHALKMMLFGTTCPPQRFCEQNQVNPTFRLDTSDDWERLEKAKAILDTYHAVGTLEHWDLSMRLFDARVKSPVAHWTDLAFKVNPGTQSTKRQELLEWAYRSPEVRHIVEGDLLLYEHGRALFETQTAESLGTTWLEFPPRPQSLEPVGDATQQDLAPVLVEGLVGEVKMAHA